MAHILPSSRNRKPMSKQIIDRRRIVQTPWLVRASRTREINLKQRFQEREREDSSLSIRPRELSLTYRLSALVPWLRMRLISLAASIASCELSAQAMTGPKSSKLANPSLDFSYLQRRLSSSSHTLIRGHGVSRVSIHVASRASLIMWAALII